MHLKNACVVIFYNKICADLDENTGNSIFIYFSATCILNKDLTMMITSSFTFNCVNLTHEALFRKDS